MAKQSECSADKLYILNTNYDPQPGEQLGLCHHPDGRNSHLRLYPWGTNPTTNDPASCIWMSCPLNDKDNANWKKKTKTKTKTNPHTMPLLPAFGCPLTTPHNTNSLSVNSGCHSECLHQNSKSQCQKLSPWFLAGKFNGAWSVTEARKCSVVFEPLGCIASVWTPLHSFLMSQIILQA